MRKTGCRLTARDWVSLDSAFALWALVRLLAGAEAPPRRRHRRDLRVARIALALGREEAGQVPARGGQPEDLLGGGLERVGADEVGVERLEEVGAGGGGRGAHRANLAAGSSTSSPGSEAVIELASDASMVLGSRPAAVALHAGAVSPGLGFGQVTERL